MASTPSNAEPAALDHDQHVRKHLVRNYLAHGVEGGMYIGGMSFLSGGVVLPKIAQSLGASDWLIAATPLVLMAGYQLPSLFTAHLIERMERLRPLLLTLGVFQRLPYLLAAAVLFFWADHWPQLALAAVMLCPFLSGLIGGMGNTAWQELVANTIPPHRRSSLWATRNIISSLIGLAGGGIVLAVLKAYPGTSGYGILHLITFALLVLSYVVFWFILEIPNPRPRPKRSIGLIRSLAQMPGLIVAYPQLRRYILCTMCGNGLAIMIPRLSIHALDVMGRPEAYIGMLVSIQTLGGCVGNFAAGFIGDRRGGKAVIAAALVGMLAACGWAMVAESAWEFWGIFFLLGGSSFGYYVGSGTLSLEVVPLDQRVRCLAIIAACGLVSMVAVWLIGWWAWRISDGTFSWVASLAAASLILSMVFVLRVKEPRHNGGAEAGAGT